MLAILVIKVIRFALLRHPGYQGNKVCLCFAIRVIKVIRFACFAIRVIKVIRFFLGSNSV